MEKDTILVVDDQTDLVHGLRRTLSIYGTIEKAIESFTLAYLNRLLGRTAGNVSAAAQLSDSFLSSV